MLEKTNKNLKLTEDLQLHHKVFIKRLLIEKLVYCLCNMNFETCSYEIKNSTNSLHEQSFCNIKLKWA